MESQGENFIHNLPHIADFRLKCCILKEDTKDNVSGSNQAPVQVTRGPRNTVGEEKCYTYLSLM
jgi:hypothetical protein